jgi:AAA domain
MSDKILPFKPAMPGEQVEAFEPKKPGDETAKRPLAATAWVWRDPKTIPPREFMYGTHYIRKFVSAGFGAPGGGKSSKRLVEALAMASCKPLLGIKPVQKLKVWYWNGEDPAEETDRRLAAACLHYGIKREDIEGYLFADSGRSTPIIICISRNSI